MKLDDKKLELKVGVFVMVGTGLVMGAILILGGKSSVFTSVSHYQTHFAKIDGLISGAKVGMGGLQVGTVSSVEFDGKNRDIEVKFTVEKQYAEYIRKDSTVEIVTQGVLGDKYLSVNAGDPSSPLVENGGEVTQGANKDLSQLFSSSEKLMLQLTSTTESLDRILSAFNRSNRADQFFQGLAGTSKNMGELTGKLNDEFSQVKIKSAINHLNSILQKVDQGQGSLGAFINDPGLYDDAKALVGQVNRNRIMRNLIRQTIKDNKEKAEDEDEPSPAAQKKK
jgi:phospholipid/cholesterol/gamma-HCH transport system substrate-binding protein